MAGKELEKTTKEPEYTATNVVESTRRVLMQGDHEIDTHEALALLLQKVSRIEEALVGSPKTK